MASETGATAEKSSLQQMKEVGWRTVFAMTVVPSAA